MKRAEVEFGPVPYEVVISRLRQAAICYGLTFDEYGAADNRTKIALKILRDAARHTSLICTGQMVDNNKQPIPLASVVRNHVQLVGARLNEARVAEMAIAKAQHNPDLGEGE